MEFKCPICGKPHTTRKEMVACTIECDNDATIKEDLEKRQKAAAEADQKRKEKEARNADLKKQAQHHLNEFLRCSEEIYADPDCYNRGTVYELKFPPEWGIPYDLFKMLGLR